MKILITIISLLVVGSAAAQPKDNPNPVKVVDITIPYPPDALQQCVEGSVTMQYTVNARGSVEKIEFISRNGPESFEDVTRKAASRWKFFPKVLDGEMVAARLEQTITFELAPEQKANCADAPE